MEVSGHLDEGLQGDIDPMIVPSARMAARGLVDRQLGVASAPPRAGAMRPGPAARVPLRNSPKAAVYLGVDYAFSSVRGALPLAAHIHRLRYPCDIDTTDQKICGRSRWRSSVSIRTTILVTVRCISMREQGRVRARIPHSDDTAPNNERCVGLRWPFESERRCPLAAGCDAIEEQTTGGDGRVAGSPGRPIAICYRFFETGGNPLTNR